MASPPSSPACLVSVRFLPSARLEGAGWKLGDIQRIESNEAMAAVPLAVAKELGLPEDIINVEGGAIARGPPIGATGAVLTTLLVHSMRRDGIKCGVVTLCIGGGQGIALARLRRRCNMPIARFHILEGRYDDTRLGKLSKAVQQGLMSVLGGRLLPDISHPAANSVLAHAIVSRAHPLG